MENRIQPFWSLLVKPGEPQKLDYPDSCFLTITNACLPELPSDLTTPIRLIARVRSEIDSTEQKVLLVSLVPIKSEHAHINYVTSPFNDIELSILGDAPIQLSGILQPVLDEDEEEEEEEEEEIGEVEETK